MFASRKNNLRNSKSLINIALLINNITYIESLYSYIDLDILITKHFTNKAEKTSTDKSHRLFDLKLDLRCNYGFSSTIKPTFHIYRPF